MRARALVALALGVAALALAPLGVRADLEPIAYTVVRGDTASRIASRHGLTLAELRELNEGLEVDRLRQGQELVIGHGRLVQHRVRPRETLTAIAERYGVRVQEILRWNEGLDAQRVAVDRELRVWARRDEPQSVSRGRVDHGALVHGISLPSHPGYVVRDAERAWVTRHVAAHLAQGFDAVLARDPDAPRVQIRDASRPEGGRLRTHRSHQSGRDVDLVYYQRRCPRGVCSRRWMRPEQLDAQLQWALLEPWIRSGAVEYVFIDHRLQEPLWQAAQEAGATRAELSAWFQWPRARHVRMGIIRHVPQHTEHLHVRFACAANDEDCIPSATTHD
ncbi:MAG: penicillin-insensitive murein endopeptidase [Myxococcota bacterium]|nr:penicillin-insensitive murein endopeptidase [Myxococcota bacterium]